MSILKAILVRLIVWVFAMKSNRNVVAWWPLEGASRPCASSDATHQRVVLTGEPGPQLPLRVQYWAWPCNRPAAISRPTWMITRESSGNRRDEQQLGDGGAVRGQGYVRAHIHVLPCVFISVQFNSVQKNSDAETVWESPVAINEENTVEPELLRSPVENSRTESYQVTQPWSLRGQNDRRFDNMFGLIAYLTATFEVIVGQSQTVVTVHQILSPYYIVYTSYRTVFIIISRQ